MIPHRAIISTFLSLTCFFVCLTLFQRPENIRLRNRQEFAQRETTERCKACKPEFLPFMMLDLCRLKPQMRRQTRQEHSKSLLQGLQMFRFGPSWTSSRITLTPRFLLFASVVSFTFILECKQPWCKQLTLKTSRG